jgi:hypothetical protein
MSHVISCSGWGYLDGEPCLRATRAAISAMAARRGCGTCCSTARTTCLHDSTCSGFHVGFAIRLIRADSSGTSVNANAVREGGGALEFGEDGFFMVEEVTNQAVGVSFLHGHGCFNFRSKDTRSQNCCEACDVCFVSGSKFN